MSAVTADDRSPSRSVGTHAHDHPRPSAFGHGHAHARVPSHHSHSSVAHVSRDARTRDLHASALAPGSIDAIKPIIPTPAQARAAIPQPPAHRHDLARDHRHAPQDPGLVTVPGRIGVAALESLASAFEPGWSLAPMSLAGIGMLHPAPLHPAVRPAPPRWHGESPDRPPSPLASV